MRPPRWRASAARVAVPGTILALLFGGAAMAQEALRGNPSAGRQIFVDRGCVQCHSIWGNGGTLGPDFAVVGIAQALRADIISYVYYVKLFDVPGDPVLGERWFREKRCVLCHAVGGAGGRVGPPLDPYARYVAPIILAEGMWNHGPAMQAQQVARGVPIPSFVGREMADIQAYIRRTSALVGRDVEFLQPPDPGAGERLFTTKGCARCHGAAGRGTADGPDLRTATLRLRVSEIAGVLWNHSFQMSAAMRARGFGFPRFQGTEMADVIAFLYYLRFNETGGDARAGQTVFAQKGCATCHGPMGQGAIGPRLSGSQAVLTPLGLATAMWNHAPAMFDVAQNRRLDWPRFEDDEMRDLAEYLRRLAQRP